MASLHSVWTWPDKCLQNQATNSLGNALAVIHKCYNFADRSSALMTHIATKHSPAAVWRFDLPIGRCFVTRMIWYRTPLNTDRIFISHSSPHSVASVRAGECATTPLLARCYSALVTLDMKCPIRFHHNDSPLCHPRVLSR